MKIQINLTKNFKNPWNIAKEVLSGTYIVINVGTESLEASSLVTFLLLR